MKAVRNLAQSHRAAGPPPSGTLGCLGIFPRHRAYGPTVSRVQTVGARDTDLDCFSCEETGQTCKESQAARTKWMEEL